MLGLCLLYFFANPLLSPSIALKLPLALPGWFNMALFHHFMVLKFKSERSLLPMVNDQASASGSHDQRASPLAQAVWPGTQPGFLVHFHSQCEVPALLVTHKASG